MKGRKPVSSVENLGGEGAERLLIFEAYLHSELK